MQAEVTYLQATMATPEQLYSEYIPDVYMKRFGNDQQGANAVVNLTSELVAAGKATNRQVKKIVRVLKKTKRRSTRL